MDYNHILCHFIILYYYHILLYYYKILACPLDDDLPCLHNGTEVLQRFGFTTPPQNWISAPADVGSLLQLISNDLLGLFILAAIMHVGAYVGLRKQANKEAAY